MNGQEKDTKDGDGAKAENCLGLTLEHDRKKQKIQLLPDDDNDVFPVLL